MTLELSNIQLNTMLQKKRTVAIQHIVEQTRTTRSHTHDRFFQEKFTPTSLNLPGGNQLLVCNENETVILLSRRLASRSYRAPPSVLKTWL